MAPQLLNRSAEAAEQDEVVGDYRPLHEKLLSTIGLWRMESVSVYAIVGWMGCGSAVEKECSGRGEGRGRGGGVVDREEKQEE